MRAGLILTLFCVHCQDCALLMVTWANGNKQFVDGAQVTIEELLKGDGQSAPASHFEYDFDGAVVQFSSAFGLKMALQNLKQMQQINLVEVRNGLQLRAIARSLSPTKSPQTSTEPATKRAKPAIKSTVRSAPKHAAKPKAKKQKQQSLTSMMPKMLDAELQEKQQQEHQAGLEKQAEMDAE